MNTSEHQQNISRIVWLAIIILVFSIFYWVTKWVGVQTIQNIQTTLQNIL